MWLLLFLQQNKLFINLHLPDSSASLSMPCSWFCPQNFLFPSWEFYLFILFLWLKNGWHRRWEYTRGKRGSSIKGAGKTGQLQKILLPTWAQSLWSWWMIPSPIFFNTHSLTQDFFFSSSFSCLGNRIRTANVYWTLLICWAFFFFPHKWSNFILSTNFLGR